MNVQSATLKPFKNKDFKPELRHQHSQNPKNDAYQTKSLQKNNNGRKQRKEMKPRVIDLMNSGSSSKKDIANVTADFYNPETKNYQTQNQTSQSPPVQNPISIHSASMVNDNRKDPLEYALKEQKYLKSKIIKQKMGKHKKQKEKAEHYQKVISEQYQKEKHRQRNNNNLGKGSTSRRVSKKHDFNISESRSKLPYGLRRHLEEMTVNATMDADNKSRDFSAFGTLESIKKTDRSVRQNHKMPKTKIVDKMKNIVPTTADELETVIYNDHKRHSSRFASVKDQDELTNRLLSHREKNDNHKALLRVAQECQNSIEKLKSESFSRKGSLPNKTHQKPANSKSFYNKNIEFERNKKQRLVNEAQNIMAKELSQNKNPEINERSRRLASSMEREGRVYDRLHNYGNKKLIMQAQEVMDDLNNTSQERPNSCNRKGIRNLLTEESKELTFKPVIQNRSKHLSRDRKIEDRLLEDAQKRKMRQNFREKVSLPLIS